MGARGAGGKASYSRAMKPAGASIVTSVVVVLLVIAAVPVLFWLVQDRLIFFPQPVASTPHLPARTLPIVVAAADGTRLHGFLVPAPRTPAPVILYFGGNAEEVSWT